MNEETYIYFHVCFINNWEKVVYDLLHKLDQFNAFDRIKEMRICSLGDECNLNHEIWNFNSKIHLYAHDNNVKLYEKFTLDLLLEDSKKFDENFNVFYLHSKGVSDKNTGKLDEIKEWTDYMITCCWETDVRKDLSIFDAIGCRLTTVEIGPHFSGNFWWSKQKYLKQLTPVGKNYYDPEKWLLSNPCLVKNMVTNSKISQGPIYGLKISKNEFYAKVFEIKVSLVKRLYYIVLLNSDLKFGKKYLRKICRARNAFIENYNRKC